MKIVFGTLEEDDVESVSNSIELPKKKKNTTTSTNSNLSKQQSASTIQQQQRNKKQENQHKKYDQSKGKKKKVEEEKPPQKPQTQIFIERTETNAWSTPGSFTALITQQTTTPEQDGEQKLEVDQQQVDEHVSTSTDKKKKKKKKKEAAEVMLEDSNIKYDETADVFITPRGLANVRNSCYINATLQGLLYVPQFYQLFKKIYGMNLKREEYRLTRAVAQFVNEFQQAKSDGNIVPGAMLVPQAILEYMKNVNTNTLKHGDQHDTHEFLLFLLQELHTELMKTTKSAQSNQQTENREEDEWKEVGKHNKANTVQEIKHEQSPISKLFSGKMRSLVKKKSVMGSLTLQPFYSLHLPIDDANIQDLRDALRHISTKERLENASMEYAIEQIPKVLIIQLNRFKFDANGSKKISKHINFSDKLFLDKSIIPSTKIKENDTRRNFELVSIICHHGKEPSGGHYSTHVNHPSNKWIHFDDSKVSFVTLPEVLKQQAYVLIYKQKQSLH